MRFSSKRGRPTSIKLVKDKGTEELQQKRKYGLTAEPLDLCLQYEYISPEQHSAGLHFRWLYTLKFGTASVRSVNLTDNPTVSSIAMRDENWIIDRIAEYNEATTVMTLSGHKNLILDLCVLNKFPHFLIYSYKCEDSRNNKYRAKKESRSSELKLGLARSNNNLNEIITLQEGLDILSNIWKNKKSNTK